MSNGAQIEVILWADDDVITCLELEPFGSETRRPIRMPILESIRPDPENAFGAEDSDDDDREPGGPMARWPDGPMAT